MMPLRCRKSSCTLAKRSQQPCKCIRSNDLPERSCRLLLDRHQRQGKSPERSSSHPRANFRRSVIR
jgi:hypothetical protein